jgi:hypothetical protein
MKLKIDPMFYIIKHRGYVFKVHSYWINMLAFFIGLTISYLITYSIKRLVDISKKKIKSKSNNDNILPPRGRSIEEFIEPAKIYEIAEMLQHYDSKQILIITLLMFASEIGGDLGSFGAGALSNKIADGYINEMVNTALTLNQQEKLNLEIFKQIAREKVIDVSKVRGAGLTRKFVPDFMKEDICKRPERNARPNSWEDTSYSYDDESFFN